VILAGAWMEAAACRNEDFGLFFDGSPRAEAKALRVCASCIVIEPCRRYADAAEVPPRGARRPIGLYGVFGAETPAMRARRRQGHTPRRRKRTRKGGANVEEVAVREFVRLDKAIKRAEQDQESRRWRMAEIAFDVTTARGMTQAAFAVRVGRTRGYVSRIVSMWATYGESANRPQFWSAYNSPLGHVRPQYERVRERRDDPMKVARKLGTLLPDDDDWPPELDLALEPLFQRLRDHYTRRRELVSA
jgi:hypothetical protein